MSIEAKWCCCVVTQMLLEEEDPLEWRRLHLVAQKGMWVTFPGLAASMDTAFDVPKPSVVSKISTHTRHGQVVAALVEEMLHVTGSASFENSKTEVR